MHSDLGGPGRGANASGMVHTMHDDPSGAAVPDTPPAGATPEPMPVPEIPGGVSIEVEPSKVRAAADVVATQVELLESKLSEFGPALRITAPAEDQVSVHAVEAWNAAVADGDTSYIARVQEYLRGLQLLAVQLRAAADQYEGTDCDSAETFSGRDAS